MSRTFASYRPTAFGSGGVVTIIAPPKLGAAGVEGGDGFGTAAASAPSETCVSGSETVAGSVVSERVDGGESAGMATSGVGESTSESAKVSDITVVPIRGELKSAGEEITITSDSQLPGFHGDGNESARGRSVAAIGAVLSAAIGGEFLNGPTCDHFVENSFFVAGLAENPSEALHVLANRSRAGQHHGDIGLGNVNAFVENTRGRHDRISSGVESEQYLATLLGFGLMRDDRNQEASRDGINCRIVMGEDQDPVAVVSF